MKKSTRAFLYMVEQAAFKMAAEGREILLHKVVLEGLLDDNWVREVPAVKSAFASLKALAADYKKPRRHPSEGGSALLQYGIGYNYDKSYPSLSQMEGAMKRGVARFERAVEQPLPNKWTWGKTPPDTFLARFPEQVYIRGNHPGKVRFWMFFYNHRINKIDKVLQAKERIVLPSCEFYFGYGDVSYGCLRGLRVKHEGVPGYNSFYVPTPQDLYKSLQQGKTVKDFIRSILP